MDRRQYPRVPYGAWVENEDGRGLSFYLAENLSIGGMLLKAGDQPVPDLGNRLRLRLVVENESRVMSVQGEVVRHGEQGGFAIRFTNLDPVRESFLSDLVGELGKQQ